MEPLTIQRGQNAAWLPTYDEGAIAAHSVKTRMRNVTPGNPVKAYRQRIQDDAREQSQAQILTTVLNGIRTSGSGMRSAKLGAISLGAIDCSAIPASDWRGAQADAMMALVLSNAGSADFLTNAAASGVGTCYLQWLGSTHSSAPVGEMARHVLGALRQVGGFNNVTDDQALPLINAMIAAHGLSPERALQLFECGTAINKQNGWSRYGEIWEQTLCAGVPWYENPWYLGAGALALVGAIWFGTRKKRSA